MIKESIPFGRTMGFKVAFCNGMAIDLKETKRLIWISGQLAFNEKEELVGKGDIKVQTGQVLKNIKAHLEQLGGSMADIVQVIVFVKDMSGLRDIHDVRLKYFKEPFPTSTLVAVSAFTHPDALIEINAVAAV